MQFSGQIVAFGSTSFNKANLAKMSRLITKLSPFMLEWSLKKNLRIFSEPCAGVIRMRVYYDWHEST